MHSVDSFIGQQVPAFIHPKSMMQNETFDPKVEEISEPHCALLITIVCAA